MAYDAAAGSTSDACSFARCFSLKAAYDLSSFNVCAVSCSFLNLEKKNLYHFVKGLNISHKTISLFGRKKTLSTGKSHPSNN